MYVLKLSLYSLFHGRMEQLCDPKFFRET